MENEKKVVSVFNLKSLWIYLHISGYLLNSG